MKAQSDIVLTSYYIVVYLSLNGHSHMFLCTASCITAQHKRETHMLHTCSFSVGHNLYAIIIPFAQLHNAQKKKTWLAGWKICAIQIACHRCMMYDLYLHVVTLILMM